MKEDLATFTHKTFQSLVDRVHSLEKKVSSLFARGSQESLDKHDNREPLSPVSDNDNAERIAALERQMAALRDELMNLLKDLQDQMNSKLDIGALQDLERQLLDRLQDMVAQLGKQFADRSETKKQLKDIHRQLKNLFDMIAAKGGDNGHNEDAMFARKGYACASCEKDLVNLYGKKVEYTPWSKLPFRDPSERIARVGQGFSKMLSIINPDQLTRYD